MRIVRGELMLFLAVVVNSMGVVFILHSGSGISPISSVPYSLNLIIPDISLGTRTYIFHLLLMIVLAICRRKFKLNYLLSFLVGFIYGICMDIHTLWVYNLPLNFILRILYFIIGYIVFSFGIATSNRCQMPIIPTDLFPKELTEITKCSYSKIKISFDVFCLFFTVFLTLLFTGKVQGIGLGTIFTAFTTGIAVEKVGSLIDKRLRFVSIFS